MVIAYLAGSKRCIQFFPGASRGGLLLAAGIGSAATLASPHIPAPAFLKTDQKKEGALHSLIRVTASLALGTLTAHFADKILKGRVSLCMHAAGRFIALETVIALAFAAYSASQVAPTPGGSGDPKTLEEKHAAYLKDPDTWNKLPEKERSEFAKQCFDKDLPALPIKEGDFDSKLFAELPIQDVAKLTKNQLEWFSAICTRGLALTIDQEFDLNAARQEEGLNPVWDDKGMPSEYVEYLLGKDKASILHPYFSENPLALAQLELEEVVSTEVFNKASGLDPIANGHEVLISLKTDEIDALTKDEAHFASAYIESDKTLTDFNKLSPEQQIAFNITFSNHEIWIWPITEEHLAAIQNLEGAVGWAHQEFVRAPVAFAAIEDKVRESLVQLFVANGKSSIEDAHELLRSLTVEGIEQFGQPDAWDWNQFFEAYPNKWSDVDSKIQQALCESFIASEIRVYVPEAGEPLEALPHERIEFLLMLQRNGFEMDAQLVESLRKHLASGIE